ncbi:MAG: hypothetical protein ACRDYD_14295 [Acidimicrobiales bacterium]
MSGTLVVLSASLAGAALAAAPLAGASAAPPSARVLSVSVPAQALLAVPGHLVGSELRITNAGTTPLPVRVSLGSLSLGNEGAVSVTSTPDPRWSSGVHVARSSVTVPPGGWFDDHVSIQLPSHLVPDTYLVGFLVTPAPTGGGNVQVINQIGSYLSLNVPGPRHRAVTIAGLRVPTIVVGSSVPVSLRLKDVGPSFVETWGEVHVWAPGHGEKIDRYPGHYDLAAGTYRTLQLHAHVGLTLGPTHVTAFAFYNHSDTTVAQLQASRTVWVVSPLLLAIVGMVLAALAAALLTMRHRRRRRRQAVHAGRPRRLHAQGRAASEHRPRHMAPKHGPRVLVGGRK